MGWDFIERQYMSVKKRIIKKVNQLKEKIEPLKIVEDRVKKMLGRWEKEFPDFQVKEVIVDLKIGGRAKVWKSWFAGYVEEERFLTRITYSIFSLFNF